MGSNLRGRRVLGATVAAAAVVLTTGVGTAFASSDVLQIDKTEPSMTLVPVTGGTSVTKTLHFSVTHLLAGPGPAATLTIDAGGLAGVAQVVSWPEGCGVSGSTATCSLAHVDAVGDTPHYLDVRIKADPAASDGDQGHVDLKASSPGLDSVADSEKVVIASGPDLVMRPLKTLTGVPVGSTVSAPIQWSNDGNAPAARTVLEFSTVAGLDLADHFSNCRYSPPLNGVRRDVTAVCVIDTSTAPGTAWRLSSDIRAKVAADAWYTHLQAWVLPPGSKADYFVSMAKDFTPGDGPALTVESATTSTTSTSTMSSPDGDLNPGDNSAELTVYADNHAHYSAVGDSVEVARGATVPVTVGMRNNGPALIFERNDYEGADLRVTFPQGATATKIPDGCFLAESGVKGRGPYVCGASNGHVEPPGYQATWTFTVRADGVLTDARGTAALSNALHDADGSPVTFPWDTSTDGYTADIVFNGSGTTASPSPSPSTPDTGSTAAPSAGSSTPAPSTSAARSGGSLASTGGGAGTGLLAGIGAAAVALGAGAFVLSRRRKAADHL